MAKIKVRGKIQPEDVLDELDKICPNSYIQYQVTKYHDGELKVSVYGNGYTHHSGSTFAKALNKLKKQIREEKK